MTETLLLALLAFTAPQDFRAPVELGGANGMRFTGSPSSKWDCGVCHDPQPALELAVRATPDTLFSQGYEPNQRYELELTLSAQAPLTAAFGLEVVSRGGPFAGTLANLPGQQHCSDGRDSVEIDGAGEAAQSVGCAPNLTRWKLTWTAPDRDLGSVTLYASAVAGDKDGSNTGDHSTARVLGIPSPSTRGQRSSGCGAPAAALLLPLGAIFWRRRGAGPFAEPRRAVAALLLSLAAIFSRRRKVSPRAEPSSIFSRRRRVDPRAEPPGSVARGPAPRLLLLLLVLSMIPAAAEATGRPRPEQPVPLAPPPPEQTAQLEPPENPGPSVHVDVGTGFGFRSLALYSNSFATPLRVQLGFPVVAVAIGFRPMRLLRLNALGGLEIEGQYQRGWVVGQKPPTASAVPSDGRVSVGYAFELGPLTVHPRFVFRVLVGGVEKNFLFDDAWYQSAGGELALAVAIGRLTIFARPQVTRLIDTGTLTEANYGKAQGGLSLGGEGGLSVQLGQSGFVLGLVYRLTHTTAAWAGGGLRSLGPIASVDQLHQGELALRYRR